MDPENNPYAASSNDIDIAVGNSGGIVRIADLNIGETAPATEAYASPQSIPQSSMGICIGENMLFI